MYVGVFEVNVKSYPFNVCLKTGMLVSAYYSKAISILLDIHFAYLKLLSAQSHLELDFEDLHLVGSGIARLGLYLLSWCQFWRMLGFSKYGSQYPVTVTVTIIFVVSGVILVTTIPSNHLKLGIPCHLAFQPQHPVHLGKFQEQEVIFQNGSNNSQFIDSVLRN